MDEPAPYPVGAVVPDWQPRPTVRAVPLTGRYVTLLPLSLEHAPDLQAALGAPGDRALWTYRPTEQPLDEAAMRDLVTATLAAPGVETWVIVPEGPVGRPEGMVSCMRIEPAHGQVEIAAVLYSPVLRRTRAATEAIHLLLRHVVDDLGYRRVEWKCDALNEPSRRAALRLGFTYEGRFRRHMVVKGRNRDTDWFSLVDAEWPLVRAAHESWLSPANFDDTGHQRSPLRVRPTP